MILVVSKIINKIAPPR